MSAYTEHQTKILEALKMGQFKCVVALKVTLRAGEFTQIEVERYDLDRGFDETVTEHYEFDGTSLIRIAQ